MNESMWGDQHTSQAERRQILKDAHAVEVAEEEEQPLYSGDASRESHSGDEGEDNNRFISLSLSIYARLSIYLKVIFNFPSI